eukprot:scaffold457411_cov17-Prasinocladus_malaysianus.AAC.1
MDTTYSFEYEYPQMAADEYRWHGDHRYGDSYVYLERASTAPYEYKVATTIAVGRRIISSAAVSYQAGSLRHSHACIGVSLPP